MSELAPLMRRVRLVLLLSPLLLAGCGVISLGVSNSPDWCPNPRNAVACP